MNDPKVNYESLRDSIITLLTDNSGTAENKLDYNLSTAVKQVKAGNPFTTPVPTTMYPTVLVRLDEKDETKPTVGGNRSEVKVTYRIFGMVRIVKSAEESDEEAMQLADNIEAILRENISINSACAYSDVGRTEFGLAETKGGVFVSLVSITLTCTKRLQ